MQSRHEVKNRAAVALCQAGECVERSDGTVVEYVQKIDTQNLSPYRIVDSLELMRKNKTISEAMFDAGQLFARDFHAAHLEGMRAMNIEHISGGGTGESITEYSAKARERIHKALEAAGGLDSPAGSALWDIAGNGMSIRQWSQNTGWSGKSVSAHEAKGILIAALGMLARFYGFETIRKIRSIKY